jgi:asparagine synthase (glutamine-hydrolysing)
MVSGGLDSSAILCQAELLKRAGAGVAPCIGISMTFPEGSDADEKQYLNEIEDCYGVRIRKVAFSRLRFADNEKAVWNSELPQLEWDSTSELQRIADKIGCRVVLDGYYADQMLANPGHLVDLARRFRWLQLRRDFAEWGRWMAEVDPAVMKQELRWILSRGLVPYKIVRAARRLMGIPKSRQPAWYAQSFRERAFRRYAVSMPDPQRFASYYAKTCYEFLMARTRLNIVEAGNKTTAIRGLEKAYPFMDTDLIEFLLAVPGHVVNWKGVPKGLFREAMKGVLPDCIRLRNWKSDFTVLNNDAAASDYTKFQSYLGPACAAVRNGYMDRTVVQSEFPHRKFDRNNSLPAVQVAAAVALESWLQIFWGSKESSSHTASIC